MSTASQIDREPERRSISRSSRRPGIGLAGALFVGILVLTYLTGGSARPDVASLLLLRPISILIAGAALYLAMKRDALRGFTPFWFLCSLAILVALQLVPLPPAVWHVLPGRGLIAEAESLLGLGGVWRPLSMTPSATYNALFSLAVPLGTLCLFTVLDSSPGAKWSWLRVPTVLIALGGVTVVWVVLQVLGPNEGPFYTYAITNADVPVGPFANRNHQAMFCASLVPLVAWQFVLSGEYSPRSEYQRVVPLTLAMVVLLLMALMTGSRAGAALALVAVALVFVMLTRRALFDKSVANRSRGFRKVGSARLSLPLAGAAVMTAIGAAWLYTGAEFFDRLVGNDAVQDKRLKTLPYLWDMVGDYFPVGSGFGSFQSVFRIIEPAHLLSRRYLNQAHNDVLQFVIEAGLPGLILMAAFVVWFVVTGVKLLRRAWLQGFHPQGGAEQYLGAAAFLSGAILLLGSIVDYPLRTPLGMAYFAVLCAMMAKAASFCLVSSTSYDGASTPEGRGLRSRSSRPADGVTF